MKLIPNFRFDCYSVIISLSLIIFSSFSTPILAQTPTSSSSSASPSADIKSKLKALQDEIASKAMQLKQEVNKHLENQAIFGYLSSKSTDQLTIKAVGGLQTIKITEFTTGTGKKTINLKDYSENDYLVALGDIDDQGQLSAKKVVKLTPSKLSDRSVVVGIIKSVNNLELTIQTKDGSEQKVLTTTYTDLLGNSGALKLASLKVNQGVITITEGIKNGSKIARFIYLFPKAETLQIQASAAASVSGQAN